MKHHLTATECHLPYGIHSITCYPTQVNTPRLHPSQTGQYGGTQFTSEHTPPLPQPDRPVWRFSIYLPQRDGRLS